ncbi:hypothetical protein Pat9b_5683 (plasmid) [Pantoea sp. At-9b]|nr:hypothetical protein Pat9b_5683 [Pantoea sp. At-9b]
MTTKVTLAGVLVVWLVYVAWMVHYYAGTFSLFTH